MIKTFLLTAATFAVLLIAQTENVQAQYLGNNCGCGFNNGIFSSPYALSRVPDPPYFAIHPPVYYSQAVPRTYGYSPYAYPGSVRTPDVKAEAPAAKVLTNPYVTPAKAKSKAEINLKDTTMISEPLEIVNPFVTQAKTKMVGVVK